MFKVGDMVVVRHHTQEEKDRYPIGWSTAMNNVEGKIGRVCEVWSRSCMVDYDGFRWFFAFDSLYLQYDQF